MFVFFSVICNKFLTASFIMVRSQKLSDRMLRNLRLRVLWSYIVVSDDFQCQVSDVCIEEKFRTC
jgi:hypothetical protein